MKSYFTVFCILIFFIISPFLTSFAHAQISRQPNYSAKVLADYKYIPKKPGHYSAQDWQAVIDSTWGPGLPTNQKLAIFDEAWNKINAEFAAFQGLDIDWDSIKTVYRPEVEAGVSRGRFAAIMSYMILALEEVHSYIWDAPVFFTPLEPGVPILYLGGNAESTSHFGATLTPLPDSSLLVLKTVSSHPLGLVPGDKVLGYDGILWKDLIKELMSFQLPIYLGWCSPASDKISNSHNLLCGAGMNWHLFDTLDVVKYATGDTMHFPTASLAGQNEFIWGNEQLPVPGVDWIYDGTANIQDPFDLGDYVSWGVVDNSNIGYIYAVSWFGEIHVPGSNVSQQFYDAIYNLMLVQNVDGLIIDQRLNYGGLCEYQQGFSLLYNSTFKLFGIDKRGSSEDHYQMSPHTWLEDYLTLTTRGDPMTLFDRPIAVLIGPVAKSGGDLSALTIKSHPMTRLFGKPTNGGFSSSSDEYNLGGNADWIMVHTSGNCYFLDDPGNYLAHNAFFPDEEVWFKQEDVANGEDTVVKAAMAWINSMIHAFNVKSHSSFVKPLLDTLTITANVANPNNHNINVAAIINTLDSVFVDSVPMYDDGNHGDSLTGDGLYGGYLNPVSSEDIFAISSSVTDLDSSHYHILPNAKRFTTIGPVVFHDYRITSSDTIPYHNEQFKFEFSLRNNGSNATATNITSQLVPLDTFSTLNPISPPEYGDIQPGSTAVGNRIQYIRFDLGSEDSVNVKFRIDISSNEYLFWSDTFSVFVHKDPAGIDTKDENLPKEFALKQNYPNPFNPRTNIEFSIPKTEFVTLKIYNLLGQEVATLVSEKLTPGNYKYSWNASGLASGIYYYQLVGEDFRQVKKMILLR